MKLPLLAACLLLCFTAIAQEPHLQLLKNGRVKKRITEGSTIILTDNTGFKYVGTYRIINDSNISVSGVIVPINSVVRFKFPRKPPEPFDWKRFAYTTAGFILSSAGMALSKWETVPNAIMSSAVIAYAQYPIQAAKKLIFSKKRKFRIGKKRKLRVWSIYPHYQPKGF
jgi:hypothetical protein